MSDSWVSSGGVILLSDAAYRTFSRDRQVIPPAKPSDLHKPKAEYPGQKGAWFALIWHEMRRAQGVAGFSNFTGRELGWALTADDHFEEIQEKALWCPNAWPGEGVEHGEELGEYGRVNFLVSDAALCRETDSDDLH